MEVVFKKLEESLPKERQKTKTFKKRYQCPNALIMRQGGNLPGQSYS